MVSFPVPAASAAAATGDKPHAVCVPYPAQGHVTPMLYLAKLLHARGFHITFVNTDYNHRRLLRSLGADSLAAVPSFRFAHIPDGLPPSPDGADDITQDIPSLCRSTEIHCLAPLRRLLADLATTGDVPPVSCIVHDTVMSFATDAAHELGVPNVSLFTASACSFVGYLHAQRLRDQGLLPVDDPVKFTNGYLDTPVEDAVGLKNVRLRDFPSFLLYPDDVNVFMTDFCLRMTGRASTASAVLFNTFDELEHGALSAISSELHPAPVYALGPFQLLAEHAVPEGPARSLGSSLWKDDPRCLPWLDGKAAGSVIYVNFGSITVMSNAQLVEFAWGLANSGHPFLWIIRPDLVQGDAAVVPPEFVKETAGRGMLASWCRQEAVLRHPAVGAFLTHSGWNSTLEGVIGGVPTMCWPFFADQQINCRYSCEEWGMAVEIGGDVRREVVEGEIRKVMGEGDDKGKEMRRKAEEWKELAARWTAPSGPAVARFDGLVNDVILKKKK